MKDELEDRKWDYIDTGGEIGKKVGVSVGAVLGLAATIGIEYAAAKLAFAPDSPLNPNIKDPFGFLYYAPRVIGVVGAFFGIGLGPSSEGEKVGMTSLMMILYPEIVAFGIPMAALGWTGDKAGGLLGRATFAANTRKRRSR